MANKSRIRFTNFNKRLAEVGHIPTVAKRSLKRVALKAAAQIMADALTVPPSVPVDTGRLKDSGFVEDESTSRQIRILYGFSAPYASQVHWSRHAGDGPGEGPKFLITHARRRADETDRELAAALDGVIRSSVK